MGLEEECERDPQPQRFGLDLCGSDRRRKGFAVAVWCRPNRAAARCSILATIMVRDSVLRSFRLRCLTLLVALVSISIHTYAS